MLILSVPVPCSRQPLVLLQLSLLLLWPGGIEANRGVPVSEHVEIDNFCFRRLNDTHQFGCSSEYDGNVGVVHEVKTAADIDYVVSAGPPAKYVAVVNDIDLRVETLDRFAESGRVAGVLVAHTGGTPKAFSPDDSCPNRYSSFYKGDTSCVRNHVDGNQMESALFRNFPFPIFYTRNRTLIRHVSDCYERFNAATATSSLFEKRKCSLKLYAPMNAAVDSVTCMRRTRMVSYFTMPTHFCDPLESKNVFAVLSATEPTAETVVVAARLDAFSLFNALAPGADAAVSGIVSLLAVADSLSHVRTSTTRTKNVLFALFNGEAFDYIGSSRCVLDLFSGKFEYNMTMDNITDFIELSQLFQADGDEAKWFAHVDAEQYADSNMRKQLDFILNNLKASGHIRNSLDSDLPVSSARRFLNKKPKLATVVITNFQNSFVNPFYNSIFDAYNYRVKDLAQQAEKLQAVVASVGNTVLRMIGAGADASVKVDKQLIEDLLGCYLVNSSCARFHAVIDSLNVRLLRDEPHPLYVSVSPTLRTIRSATVLTYLSLAYITGQPVDNITTGQECFEMHEKYPHEMFTWMYGEHPTKEKPGICVQHLALMTPAKSPAFDDESSENKLEYSTWTESIWIQPELSLFIQASGRSQMTALVLGLAIFATSMTLGVLISRKSDEIFEDPTAAPEAASPVAC